MNRLTIKKAFENWEADQIPPKLPEGHEQHFSKRLVAQKQVHKRRRFFGWAAVILLSIGMSQTYMFLQEPPTDEVIKFQKAEAHFTQIINQQLEEITAFDFPQGKRFLKDYKVQMNRIQSDYKTLYEQWEDEPNQSKLIQALIANLKTQMDLLTELQNQLISLQNNKNENKLL